MNCAVVIPTRNEAASIGHLVATLRSLPLRIEVIVVDNHSADDTAERALHAGALVIVPDAPLPGIGPCLRLGFTEASRMDVTHVVQMDAGGSHDPYDLPRMLADSYGVPRSADLVIGSRFIPTARYIGRPWRAFCSRMVARVCNVTTGAMVHDWTSGYRVWSWTAALDALSDWPAAAMHGVQLGTLDSALRRAVVVHEVPITYHAGRSSFRLSTAIEALRAWWRMVRPREAVQVWS